MKLSGSRWLAVILGLAAALGIGMWLGGRMPTSPMARSAPLPVATPAPLQLSEGDVWVVRSQTLTRSLQVSGTLKAIHTAVIKAKVAAEVKALTVREGDAVKAGQLIGQLDTTELALRLRQAEQAAATSRAQADIARRALDNNRALVTQGFISPTGLETSVSNEAAARATYQAALAATALARKTFEDAQLRSPMTGRISQRLVQPGERVPLDARLLEVVDLRQMELEASLPPDELGQVHIGQTAVLQVDGVNETLRARVVRINPSTQTGTRSVLIYLALMWETPDEPPVGVRHGQFAQGTIELERRDTLAVPLNLVQLEAQPKPNQGTVLALVDGRVKRQSVSLGAQGEVSQGGQRYTAVAIEQGVTPGMVLLRPSVGPVPEGTLARQAAAPAPAASAPP